MSDQPPVVYWEAPGDTAGPAPGVEFAPHGQRLVAYLIDSVLLTAVLLVLFLVPTVILFDGFPTEGSSLDTTSAVVLFVCIAIGILVSILYFPFFWARGGRTPGMRPFGLVVVRDADGQPFGWGAALLRLVGMYVASSVFYLGFAWILFDKRHRGWQDLIAGTVVVKRRA